MLAEKNQHQPAPESFRKKGYIVRYKERNMKDKEVFIELTLKVEIGSKYCINISESSSLNLRQILAKKIEQHFIF